MVCGRGEGDEWYVRGVWWCMGGVKVMSSEGDKWCMVCRRDEGDKWSVVCGRVRVMSGA